MLSTQPADLILTLLDSGDWMLTRHPEADHMTPEYNDRNAWGVQRQTAPFCDAKGLRHWTGATPYEAFTNAHQALGLTMPRSAEPCKYFEENQLELRFALGKGELPEDDDRYVRCHQQLNQLFNARAQQLFSVRSEHHDDAFEFVPIELCDMAFESEELDNALVFGFWFFSSMRIDTATGRALRDLTMEACVTALNGEYTPRFVAAKLHTKSVVNEVEVACLD